MMISVRESMYGLTERLARLIAPGNRYSQYIFEDTLRSACPGLAWLDLGCGHRLLPEWREAQERSLITSAEAVVGVDLDLNAIRRHRSISLRALADAGRLPFREDSFELVTANMVVEHLSGPVAQFSEIARVLKPGGLFIFHTPNADGYIVRASRMLPDVLKKVLAGWLEGRESADVYPTHYLANTASDVNRIAPRAGLLLERADFVSTSPVFGVVPPLALIELIWIRILQATTMAPYRTNLIVTLRKAPQSREWATT
jgi:SAM-dependent methyltransferase